MNTGPSQTRQENTYRVIICYDFLSVYWIALPALECRAMVILVFFAFLDDGEFGHLGGWFVVSLMLVSRCGASMRGRCVRDW